MPPLRRIAEKGLTGCVLGEDTILFSRREGVWKHEDIETDAWLVFVGRDDAGVVTGFAVSEATTLKVGGKEVFASDTRVTAAGVPGEVVTDDGGEWRATQAERGMPTD